MKKVSLITLHRVPNYGSVLQCYATQRKIEELGMQCEVIDYFPQRTRMRGMLYNIKNKGDKFRKSVLIRNLARVIIFPSYLKRFHSFRGFLKKYIKMTDKTYIDNEAIKNDLPLADIYCTGSDQVWNSEWNEGIDRALFLDFVPDDKRRIAYAASFGKSKLDEREILETKELLKRYHKISTRELNGVDVIKSLGIDGAENVLDPTLLLTGDEWRKIESDKFKKEKYVLVYNLNRSAKIDKYAKNLAKKKNLKIKYISYQLHEFYKHGKMYCNPKVEDFLALFDNAEYVVTDSFHATAFSINFNTNFVIVFPRKFSIRVKSLLELTKLEDRVAKDENDLSICSKKIDFKYANQVMKQERKKSIEWLKKALEED